MPALHFGTTRPVLFLNCVLSAPPREIVREGNLVHEVLPPKEKAANTFRMLAAFESLLRLIYGDGDIHRVADASRARGDVERVGPRRRWSAGWRG